MRKKIQGLFLIIMMMTLLSGCTIGETEYVWDLNTVGRNDILSINGEECSQEEAKLYLCNYQNLYGTEYGVNLWECEFPKDELPCTLEEYVKDITISQLSNIMCMNQLADQKGISLTKEEKELVQEAADEYYKTLSQAELEYIGMDKKDLEGFYEKYALAEKLFHTLTQGVNEEVSLDEARVIRIEQIYVTSLEKALEVQKKLELGEKFTNVAGAYNEAVTVETIIVRGELPKAVEDVAYTLDNEEQSGMIKVENGYYFVKCLCKNEEELTENNKQDIIVKRRKEQFDDVFTAFVEESEFEINQKAWDRITVDTSGEIKTNSFFEVYEAYFAEE